MTFNKLKREAEKLRDDAYELNQIQKAHSDADYSTAELHFILSKWLGENK